MSPIEPRHLPDGGHIRVVPVAGRVDRANFDRGITLLKTRGFRVSYNTDLLATGHPYLAADDAQRSAALEEAFLDPDVDAVVCARGGYGSMRLLGSLDVGAIARSAKPFAGYSDNTALHLAFNKAGLITYHAPVVTALGKAPLQFAERSVKRLIAALQGRLAGDETLEGERAAPGIAHGPLVGGNLSLLAACLPCRDTSLPRGCVLLVEEVAEPLYRIDRMLTGLKMSGLLDHVEGVALGSFFNCGSGPHGSTDAANVAVECLSDLGVPVVSGLPIGHRDDDLTVPLGRRVDLDGDSGCLILYWGA